MGGTLTHMMHEGNGGGVIALQAAQIGEQGGDFRGDVLVDGMQTHQRVKQDEVRPEKSHGRLQGLLVLLAIEPQRRHGDDMDIEALEFDARGMGNALETTSDDLRGSRILIREPSGSSSSWRSRSVRRASPAKTTL